MLLKKLARKFLLIIVPAPVIAGSMMLSTWAHTDQHAGAAQNQVHFATPFVASDVQPRPRADQSLVHACEETALRLEHRLHNAVAGRTQVIVRAPFVIGGNLTTDELQKIYEQTIRPAAGAMHREYFNTRPSDPVTILLFSDEATYRGYAAAMFGQHRTSIYGYYKPSVRTVVINLGAGAGTIVHELTHALIDFDCPALPIWMNEGIASLHEECRLEETPGGFQIRPLVNWRLGVLQQAIARETMRPTRELMMLERMVGEDEALNYAHARYFCMYLSEMGLLDDFYRLVRQNPSADDSGRTALRSLLSELSGYGLDEDFQRWVMQLQLNG